MFLHSSRTRRLQEAKNIDQHRIGIEFSRRHSPREDERSRVRIVDTITVKHRGDIDRKRVALVDHVVNSGAKLARDHEQAAFELLIDFHFGIGFWRRKWLFSVFDPPV